MVDVRRKHFRDDVAGRCEVRTQDGVVVVARENPLRVVVILVVDDDVDLLRHGLRRRRADVSGADGEQESVEGFTVEWLSRPDLAIACVNLEHLHVRLPIRLQTEAHTSAHIRIACVNAKHERSFRFVLEHVRLVRRLLKYRKFVVCVQDVDDDCRSRRSSILSVVMRNHREEYLNKAVT